MYALIFTVIAGITGILGFFGINASGDDSSSKSPPVGSSAESAASVGPTAPDPYLYIAFNSIHVARKQPCIGLLGLCLGQSISVAIQALGTAEADGFPEPEPPDGSCHGWELKQLDRITICERKGGIRRIRIDSLAQSTVRVAAPRDTTIVFPDPIADVGTLVTSGLQAEPYASDFVNSEGETIFSFSWYLSAPPDGPPDTTMTVIGRRPGSQEDKPHCPGSDAYYPYQTVRALGGDVPITSVEVGSVEDDQVNLGVPC
jgi:hypothetical protein